MVYVESKDGTSIKYDKHGNGDHALILIHGWVNNRTVWDHEKNALSDKYKVISFDLRGHGESDPVTEEKISLESFSQDIDAILEKEDIETYTLIGHSMGGMIALHHEATRKDGKKLILLDTSPKPVRSGLKKIYNKILDLLEVGKHLDSDILHQEKDVDLTPYGFSDYLVFIEGLKNTNLHVLFACLEMMIDADLIDQAKTIDIPTLILYGKGDTLLQKKESTKLHNVIDRSYLEEIDGKHHINISEPEAVERKIRRFLD